MHLGPKGDIGVDFITNESNVMLLTELQNDSHVLLAIHTACGTGGAVDKHNARHGAILQGLAVSMTESLFWPDRQQ
jgi:hypothetical protein